MEPLVTTIILEDDLCHGKSIKNLGGCAKEIAMIAYKTISESY